MSAVLPRVKESQTSGGTGNLTGCAAVSGFLRGDTAPGGALNRRYKYWIIDGTTAWEYGIGYKSATGTFVRETVLGNSSGTTAAINASASAEIISMAHPGVDAITFPAVYSEDGDGVSHLNPVNGRYTSTTTLSADTLYVQECIWLGQSPVSTIGFDLLGAPGGTGTVYMGFYEINSVGEPGTILAEGSQAVTAGSTQAMTTFSVTTPVLFRYCYVGIVSTVTLPIRAANSGNVQFTMMGLLGSDADTPISLLSAAVSTPSALPAAPTAWTRTRVGVDLPEHLALYGS